jgi:hypothetical protein
MVHIFNCLRNNTTSTCQCLDIHAVLPYYSGALLVTPYRTGKRLSMFRTVWLSPCSRQSHAPNKDGNSIVLQNVVILTQYTAVSSLMNENNIHHTSKFISEIATTYVFI